LCCVEEWESETSERETEGIQCQWVSVSQWQTTHARHEYPSHFLAILLFSRYFNSMRLVWEKEIKKREKYENQ
jgi:hypothetical protein